MRLLLLFVAATAFAQSNITPVNVQAEEVTYKGKKALRLTDHPVPGAPEERKLAMITGSDFRDGVIEFDMAGDRMPNAPETARGFTGFAFRVNAEKYNAFYLRPFNGRSGNQVQRNHSAQYISSPEFGWERLRRELPKMYETYVDLVPGEWVHVKIEVRGATAKLFVNGTSQPTLLVTDLKGGNAKGALAWWIGPGSVSHFANLQVTQ